jgi:crotonobetainyl-CoA:carnitine CoA-transferase CaiB-like acyl-CoA transferase
MPELRRRLEAFTAAELTAIFEKAGLPFAPIVKPEELFDDPHLQATGGLADVRLTDGPKAGQSAPRRFVAFHHGRAAFGCAPPAAHARREHR